MQISGSGIPPLFRLSITPQTLKGLPLQDGAQLTATVLSSDDSGKLTLEISGKLLKAVSTLRLTAGMTLQLRVEKSNDQVLLQLDDKTVRQLTHNQALRQSLPQQEPLKPLIERLQQLLAATTKGNPPATETAPKVPTQSAAATETAPKASTQNTTEGAQRKSPEPAREPAASGKEPVTQSGSEKAPPGTALPRPVLPAIERLLAALPRLTQATDAAGLKQAIASSGLFLENTLLQSQRAGATDKDVKTALLRLAQIIRQNLSNDGGTTQTDTGQTRDTLQTLLRQVDSGLARIQLHQLNTLNAQQTQGDERQIITLELPLLHPQEKTIETLQLKIQREKSKGGSGAGDCWSVTLHLNPADFGEIHAVVSLTGGKVSTTFWCQQEQTGALFRQQLDELQQRLGEQGLEVGRCTAITGKPPENVSPESDLELAGLIDTRA